MKNLTEYIDINSFAHSLGYVLTAFLIFYVGKLIYKLLNPKINIDNELVHKDNFAFILSYVGYFIGLIIVLGGAIVGESAGFYTDLFHIGLYGIIGVVLLQVSIIISNKLILPNFDIKKEIIKDQNEGTGVIEACIYIANALLLHGALIGEATSLQEGILTFISYWAIGNIMLVIAAKVFTLWIRFDVHEHIEKDNIAVGVSFGGAILAIGIVIMNALIDPFIDWTTTLIDVTLQTILGIILLPIMRFLTDKILLPGRSLTDEIINQEKPNIGAGLIEAFAYVGSAILITWSI
ncbi:DUF350 domain-containing protein [Tenacibaculum sp. 190524A02b]|uniref:DUF350 domain-containing protein n=1 Tax=Tenacibaculum vairaonense TaxID=3137860 RepID=UPI0031FAB783